MKKLASFNIGILLALAISFYCAYYILLHDNFLHISIASIIASSHQLRNHQHLLVLGLLPVYIGTMIFGAGLLGVYLGSILQRCVLREEKIEFFCKDEMPY